MALPDDLRCRLTLPVIVAPMFLCSSVALAAEACKAGLIGTLTQNNCRHRGELEAQLIDTAQRLAWSRDKGTSRLSGPLAVNLSLRHELADMCAHVELCRRHGASIIITASGDPSRVAPIIRGAGLLHYHDVTSIRFAEKAIRAGVDGLIAIGAGGGGHSGTISHFALIPALRALFDGTIVMAGAIANGAGIRAAEILGADLAYIGTRFIATQESVASDAYKAMLVEANTDDVLYTSAVNGVPANWLKPSLVSLGLDPANLPPTAAHIPPHVKPWKNLWSAGQSVSLIEDVPTVARLVRRLQRDYIAACELPDIAEAARAALGGE